jgi:hypothetical protein
MLRSIFCILLLSAAVIPAFSQITLSDVPPGRVAIAAFKIGQPEKIKIAGTAGNFYERLASHCLLWMDSE